VQFTSFEVRHEFYAALYNQEGKASAELGRALAVYFMHFTCTVLVNLGANVALFEAGTLGSYEFSLQVAGPLALLSLGYFVLMLLICCRRVRMQSHSLMTCLSVLTCLYLTISDRRVTSHLFGSDYNGEYANNSISVVGIVIVNQYALFSNFLAACVHVLCTLAIKAALFFSLSSEELSVTAYDFVTLVLFCGIVLVIVRRQDFTAKEFFWGIYRERTGKEDSLEASPVVSSPITFSNEFERMVHEIDQVKKSVEMAVQSSKSSKVKSELMHNITSIDNLKQAIIRGVTTNILAPAPEDANPEGNEFVLSHFSTITALSRKKTTFGPTGMFDNPDPVGIGIKEIESLLFSVGRNWNFEIWPVHSATSRSVSLLGKYLSYKWQFATIANCRDEDFEDFFIRLEEGYLNNPYHNACHAADVMNSVLFFILSCGKLKDSIDPLDMLVVTIATLGHDVAHPGLSNKFLVNSRHYLATRYNDNSVLENMHTSMIFDLIHQGRTDILGNLSEEDWARVRRCIIEMVLATDLSKHFELLSVFKTRAFNLANINLDLIEDRLLVLKLSLKCGDIGHSAKELYLHQKWTLLVSEEFFKQGDIEQAKGLPISMFCDRKSTDLAKTQAGFLKGICLPLFEALGNYFQSDTYNTSIIDNLHKNISHWESLDISRRRRSMFNEKPPADALSDLRKSISKRAVMHLAY
jgi:hypothetical protein